MSDAKEFQEKLKALSDAYAAQLPEKLNQIQQAWEALPNSSWDDEGFRKLYHLIHSMTGSGNTFGFKMISEVSHVLEEYLKPLKLAKQVLNPEQRLRIKDLISELHQVVSYRDNAALSQDSLIAINQLGEHARPQRRIFVVEDNHEFADELQIHLSYFGYDVSVFYKLKDFRAAMKSDPNVVVLMDVNFPEDDMAGIKTMMDIQQGREVPVPVLFVSAYNEFKVRLDAALAGGIAYLNKPPSISNLIDKLDELTSSSMANPYRVLIVDNSTILTEYYSAVLEQAGLKVCAVNDPFMIMEPLQEFAPDLILIDIFMPGCNGIQLAKVIRQFDAYVSIPIVFLSAETDLDQQMLALSMGGDDFLTKPIQPQHLVSAVISHAHRSQLLRSFMVRDSLTGLLNHTAIKDQLDHEVVRAKRQGTALSFAMIDIDHFKQVNDTYGHPVGDRVIKSLSRLLKQRLRENDIVGRYGGEEFAVILIDTDAKAAVRVLDTIREDFSRLRHITEGQEFNATFSCGIVDITHFDDAGKICEAADRQLYKAKQAGRNRVMAG